jgi:hypothetical protein
VLHAETVTNSFNNVYGGALCISQTKFVIYENLKFLTLQNFPRAPAGVWKETANFQSADGYQLTL